MQQFVITHAEGNRLVFPEVIALNPQNILTAEEKTNGCDILYEQTTSEKIDLILYRVANKKSQITGLDGVNLVDVSVYDKATGATRTIAVKGDIVSYTEEAAFRSNTGSVNCRKIYLESLKYSKSFYVSNTTEYILENLGSKLNPVLKSFYVANDGNDENDGLSESTPFASLEKVNTLDLSGEINQVLFKAGDSWMGTITVNNSGTSEKPIVYGTYGTGSKPKIYGSEVITGWTLHSGNIWKATVAKEVRQIFVNDKRVRLARYPDEGYFYIDEVNSSSSFTCNALDVGIDYSGATLRGRYDSWSLSESAPVLSSDSSTLTTTSSTSRSIDNPFFLVDKLDFLTQAGEWYYDSNTSILYLWTPGGDSPDNYIVRGSVNDNNIYLNGRDFVTIRGLQLEQAATNSIYIRNYTDVTIDNVSINNADGRGIHASYGVNSKFINNSINNTNNEGIVILNWSIDFEGGTALIENNVINNVGVFGDIGKGSLYSGSGIFIQTSSPVVRYNRLYNIAYSGIHFLYSKDAIIENNFIDGYCKTIEDGAGIYTWTGQSNGLPNEKNSSGSLIRNNIILNDYPTNTGWHRDYEYYEATAGIYCDEGSNGILIEKNLIANTSGKGIFLHQTMDIEVKDNVIFNSGSGIMLLQNTTFSNNNNITQNLFYNIYSSKAYGSGAVINPRLVFVDVKYSAYSFDYNTYVDRYRTEPFFVWGSGDYESFFSYKTKTGGDANSTFIGTPLSPGETEQIVVNDTTANKTFYLNNASNLTDVDTETSIDDSFVLSPFTWKIIKGLSPDCVLDYEDSTAPVITAFELPATSESFIVAPTLLLATGDATAYILTESDTVPNLYDEGWSLSPSYTVDSSGLKTLYAWARDKAGNISISASDTVDITVEIAGYPTVYAQTSSTTVRRGMPITMTEDGLIKSVSFYHKGGAGNFLVGVYADDGSGPSERLAISAETALGGLAAWYTADLLSPVYVQEGTKVWIVFTSSIGGSKYEAGTPFRAQATSGDYNDGLPDPFGTSNQSTNRVSVYCTYVK